MPVHSLHFTNLEGYLLFSKYYDYEYEKDINKYKQIENQLYEHTKMYWNFATSTQSLSIRYYSLFFIICSILILIITIPGILYYIINNISYIILYY